MHAAIRKGGKAWNILGGSRERLIEHSAYLKTALLQAARQLSSPRKRRFGIQEAAFLAI
jgi:hypothetical protein